MALLQNAKTSLTSFLLGCLVLGYSLMPYISEQLSHFTSHYWRLCLAGDIVVINCILYFLYTGPAYQVAIRAGLLGLAFGVGIILSISESTLSLFGWYLCALAFFHWSEYFTTAVTNPRTLTLSSYLLDHSKEYHLAAVASLMEFVIEWYFFPNLKQPSWVSVLGLMLVLAGECLRKVAMITASTNFNHYVQHVKQDGHRLVTWGVYSISRHPAYMGWFYWSVGTQVMLGNPVCALGYSCASWLFFRSRIEHEEVTLLNFFGEEYVDYQKRVGTGLPFIRGYRVEL